MTPLAALSGFALAAGLLTLTPGLDTLLVLRTAATEGRRAALFATLGVGLGCLAWGVAVALGLGVLLTASQGAYRALTFAGALYLLWLGAGLLLRPRRSFDLAPSQAQPGEAQARRTSPTLTALRRGLVTNLLNPKIGIFYVSFLPQFVPAGWAAGPTMFGLAGLHVGLGLLWLGTLAAGVGHLRGLLGRPGWMAALDRVTGLVFVAFGLRLALHRPA